jgi:hypothetical protein
MVACFLPVNLFSGDAARGNIRLTDCFPNRECCPNTDTAATVDCFPDADAARGTTAVDSRLIVLWKVIVNDNRLIVLWTVTAVDSRSIVLPIGIVITGHTVNYV